MSAKIVKSIGCGFAKQTDLHHIKPVSQLLSHIYILSCTRGNVSTHLLCNAVNPSPLNKVLYHIPVFPHLHLVGCRQHQWSIASLCRYMYERESNSLRIFIFSLRSMVRNLASQCNDLVQSMNSPPPFLPPSLPPLSLPPFSPPLSLPPSLPPLSLPPFSLSPSLPPPSPHPPSLPAFIL